jgi:two-component system, NtrC family, nitrogen regulation sensor histidine kinase GlnL
VSIIAAQHSALLEAQSTPALLTNGAGQIVWANPAVQTLLKVGLKQLRGSPLNSWLVAASLIDTLPSIMAQVSANPGQPVKLDVRLVASQEPLQAVLSATESVSAVDGTLVDWPIAIELVNHAPALLIQAAEHRAQQQTAQRELLRNLAHEIRNPLGGIRGAAQLLARELGNTSQSEYTDVIVAEATRLQVLLDRLLSAQATPRTLSMINVHELLERVRSLVSAEFPNQLQWGRDYDVSLPDVALDEHQMMQVLMNLVRNAAQIMIEAGQDEKRITLRTRALRQVTLGTQRHKLALELLIEDNGPGIPPSIRPHLFNPLVTQRAGGTGLGLHIAQSFVQQHGGTIEVDSKPGCTVFKVALPVVKTS